MRFLLNLPTKLIKRNPPSARRVLAARSTRSSDTATEEHTFQPTPTPTSTSTQAQAWSQQCGAPTCGCMLRLQVDMTSDSIIKSAEYHSKALVLSTEPSGTTSRRELAQDGTWHNVVDTHYRFIPALTSKGRPMITECKCKPLKRLANAVCEQLPNKSMAELRNSLEFASTRSSPAFRQHLLNVFGYSNSLHNKQANAGRCFDLVEEVFVGLIKGYMPATREEHQHDHDHPYYKYNQEYYDGAEDGNRRSRIAVASHDFRALNNAVVERNKRQEGGVFGQSLDGEYFDWVSFVDDQKERDSA